LEEIHRKLAILANLGLPQVRKNFVRSISAALLSFENFSLFLLLARRILLSSPRWSPCRNLWGLGLPPNDISGEIFRKLDRGTNCRCSRQRRPIGVAPGRTGGGQSRLKRGHSLWSCQSSVGHGHARSSRSHQFFRWHHPSRRRSRIAHGIPHDSFAPLDRPAPPCPALTNQTPYPVTHAPISPILQSVRLDFGHSRDFVRNESFIRKPSIFQRGRSSHVSDTLDPETRQVSQVQRYR